MSIKVEQISLMHLFSLGAHRGNKKSALNPRLKKRVYGVNKGLSVIDLVETKASLERCARLLDKIGQKKGQLLVVGTSVHTKKIVEDFVSKVTNGQAAYVNYRWLGGTLTNWSTIRKTLKTLDKTKSMVSDRDFFDRLSRNEQLALSRKLVKLEKFFNGLTVLKNNKPSAVIVLDAKDNPVAIKEAEAMKIPVIAITNTNVGVLPEDLQYTIVCNTSSINCLKLIMEVLSDAYNEGFNKANLTITITQKEKNNQKQARQPAVN